MKSKKLEFTTEIHTDEIFYQVATQLNEKEIAEFMFRFIEDVTEGEKILVRFSRMIKSYKNLLKSYGVDYD